MNLSQELILSKTKATVSIVLRACSGRFYGKYAGLPAQEAKALPPQAPQATSASYIQRHWLLPPLPWEAASLHWCNGGCPLKVLSWLMQLSPFGCRISVSYSFLYSPAVYSFHPSPYFFLRTCHYVSTSVGGSGSAEAGAPRAAAISSW